MTQYDPTTAAFFAELQFVSGRATLYAGYLTAWLARVAHQIGRPPIAVDFGCGNGLYACALAQAGAAGVTGYDPSEPMLADARPRAAMLGVGDRVRFTAVKADLPDHADAVVTLHTTYHFPTDAALAEELFAPMARLLTHRRGEALVIVADPAHVAATPAYYSNAVTAGLARALAPAADLPGDEDGYVPLAEIAKLAGDGLVVADKTPMRATFRVGHAQRTIDDTFHTMPAILAAARVAGLENTAAPVPLYNIKYPQPHAAYLAIHFRPACR